MPCEHNQFEASVDVSRIKESEDGPVTAFMAEVRVKCVDCGQPFRFKCSRIGVDPKEPMASADGQELRCPIEPSDGTLVTGLRMGFEITARPGSDPSNN